MFRNLGFTEALESRFGGINLSLAETAARLRDRTLFLAFCFPAAAAFSACQSWFREGAFIASGDGPPFFRDSFIAEAGSLWTHHLTSAGGPSFEIVRAPEMGLVVVTRLFSLNELFAQRLFFLGLIVWLAIAGAYLAAGITSDRLAIASAGLIAVFNPYVLQSIPNPIPLWTIAASATLGGVLVRVARGEVRRPALFALASIPICYLALNPPLLLIAVATVLIVLFLSPLIGGSAGLRRTGSFLARATPYCLLLNAWWLFPFAITLLRPGAEQHFTAQTDILSWGWTHARNSLGNVVTISGHWGWDYREYFPYADFLGTMPLSLAKFGLPIAAVASLFVVKGRRLFALGLIVVATVLIFVGKGVHPPLEEANYWIYDHAPGMWLLREPLSKVGAALVVVYVLAIALSIAGSLRLAHERNDWISQIPAGLIAGAVVASLCYAFPLWNGAVVPDDRPRLPSAHVLVPNEWRQIARTIDESPRFGRVLVLPINDYYQMPTSWGYYGIDVIPRWMLDRPAVQLWPQAYFSEDPSYLTQISELNRALRTGDGELASTLLQRLAISHVVVRHDIRTHFRSTIPGVGSLDDLGQMSALSLTHDGQVADVYEITNDESGMVQLDSDESIVINWARSSPSSYEVRLPSTTEPVTLTLAESYSPEWTIDGLPKDRTAEHFRANGYANGWHMDPGDDVRLRISYRPQLWFMVFGLTSLATLLVICAGLRWQLRTVFVGVLRSFLQRRTRGEPVGTPSPVGDPHLANTQK